MARWLGWILAVGFLLLAAALVLLAVLPGNWLARQASALANSRWDAEVDIAEIDFQPFSLTPQLQLSGVTIERSPGQGMWQFSAAQASVDLRDLLRGDVLIDRLQISDAAWDLPDLSGEAGSWQARFRQRLTEASPLSDFRENVPGVRIRHLLINDMSVSTQAYQQDGDASQSVMLRINGAASTSDSGSATRLQIDGTLQGRSLRVSAELPYLHFLLHGFPEEAGIQQVNVQGELGESRLQLEGSVENPSAWQDVSMAYTLGIASNEDWQVLVPELAENQLMPLNLSGEVLRGRDDWLLRNIDGQWGHSDLGGEVRIDATQKPLSVDARLHSRQLQSREMSALLSLPYRAAESGAGTLDEVAIAYQHLLQVPTVLDERVQGSVDYRADAVLDAQWPVSMIDVQINVNPQQLTLALNRMELDEAVLEGEVDISSDSSGVESSLDVYLKRFELSNGTLPEEEPGRLAAHLILRLTAAPGGGEVQIQEGQLLALAAGADVSTALARLVRVDKPSMLLQADDEQGAEPVACSFTDLQLHDGSADIATLVMASDDSILIGDGRVSWHEGVLDVSMESHPMNSADASVTASAWQVSGPLSAPLRKTADPLLARETAAAVLTDMLMPAARLLPYLDSGQGVPYGALCSGMANALHDVR